MYSFSDENAGDPSLLRQPKVWGGGLAADGNRRKAWMSQHVARAPVADGGLYVPHLTRELQVVSLGTIERWLRLAVGAQAEICRVLLKVRGAEDGLLAPSRRVAPASPCLQPSLAATGVQLRRALATAPREQPEIALLRPLFTQVGRGTSVNFDWDKDWLRVDYSRVHELLQPLQHHQGAVYGNLQVHSLQQARAVGDDILWVGVEESATITDFPGLIRANDRLGDKVEIDWARDGTIRFRPVRHTVPLPPLLTVQFRRFCDILVFNFPGVLRPPAQLEYLVLRPPTLDVWRLRPTRQGRVLEWSPVEQALVVIGIVTSTKEATRAARAVLRTSGPRDPTADAARVLLRGSHVRRCDAENEARRRRWKHADESIAVALDTVDWSPLMRTAGAPAAHRLLFHKLKGGRVTGWNRVHACRGCPHCQSLGSAGGELYHIFWACPRAQDRWAQLLLFWSHLRATAQGLHSTATKKAVFGLKLRPLPDGLWVHGEIRRLGDPTEADTVATEQALPAVWRRQVLFTLHLLWRWRTEPDEPTDIWTAAHARHGAALQSVSHGVRWDRSSSSADTKLTAAALDIRFGSTASPVPSPSATAPADVSYLLFFDGGSRGNPGPGGSGAVIVKVDPCSTAATVVWTAAMARGASTTTNNQAEYHGLLTGLAAAHEHGFKPLEVIGDSQLILRQMAAYRPPQNRALLALYAPARQLADALSVIVWTHHRRAYNSMADAAANVAMDCARSSQVFHPTERQEHTSIAGRLANDFSHWQVRHLAQ